MSTPWPGTPENNRPIHTNPHAQPHYGQPAAHYSAALPPQAQTAPKSKRVAALLFFFFGILGVGNFYLGQKKRGFTKLGLFVLGVLGYFIFIGIFVLAGLIIWSLTEFVMVLKGSDGYDRDQDGIRLV